MPIAAHLEELRRRLFLVVMATAILFLVGWGVFKAELEQIFVRPHQLAVAELKAEGMVLSEKLVVLSPLESIFFDLRICLLVAVLLSLPWALFQGWMFIASGLRSSERRAVARVVPFSVAAGALGLLFGYFFMIPLVLRFLYATANPEVMLQSYRLADYLSIFLLFTLALALLFQLPILLSGLGAAGLVSAKSLRKHRRHFILGAFVIGAIVTPPDPVSQLLMAVPVVLLFEFGIFLVAFRERRATAPVA